MLFPQALHGSWILESADVVDGDRIVDSAPFGSRPSGMLHYLENGCMAVLIAHEQRPVIAGGRTGATDAERLAAARTFTAYGGSYDVENDRVVHHVVINSFPNDVGVDYPRIARLDGNRLILATPRDLPADQRPMRLIWKRYSGRS